MIPVTYPVVPSGTHNAIVVFPLSSVVGLQEWIDYIPVRQSTIGFINSFDGYIVSSVITNTTGLQQWKDYIPVFVDNSKTIPFSTNSGGYIPISDVGTVESGYILSDLDRLLADASGNLLITN